MTKHEIAKAHYKGGVFNRRTRALGRLEQQLKSNTKPSLMHIEGSGNSEWRNIPLQEKDVKRIRKEIEILKSKI